MNNRHFREKLRNVLTEIGTEFMGAEQMNSIIERFKAAYLKSLETSYDRYYGLDVDSGIEDLLNSRNAFFEDRYSDIMRYMDNYILNPDESIFE